MAKDEKTERIRDDAKRVLDRLQNTDSGTLSDHDVFGIISDVNLKNAVMSYLITDLQYVDKPTQFHFRLTKLGREFTTFENLDNDAKLESEHRQTEFDLAKSNIKANDLNEKNSNFNKNVNIANIVISVINILVALGLGWWSYKVGLLK